VFQAPWERRVFGLTMALVERGAIDYESFRENLIVEIAAWERSGRPEDEWSYYRCWVHALESRVLVRGARSADALETRTRMLAQRPHGHDHG
jgi:nitrile hydratase accessory protein